MPTLYIIRGLPGSGKSTLAREIAERFKADHWEADQYFVDNEGNYKWDGNKITEAHNACADRFIQSLINKRNVVVSNTFTRCSELYDYVSWAQTSNYDVVIIECLNHYGSIHNVPDSSMERMRARWQSNSKLKDACKDLTSADWDDVVMYNSEEFELAVTV